MSFSNALKYKIVITPSYYAGVSVFLLYSIAILLALFVTPLSSFSLFFYLLLFLIALIAAKKAYNQSSEILVSESALVQRTLGGKQYHGKISEGSFYNHFFIFLQLKEMSSGLADKQARQYMTLYRDAISKEHYRLLARLINSGRS